MSKNKFGKKLFKKIGTIGLAITGAFGLLTGCGKPADTTAEASTIKDETSSAVYRTVDEIKEAGSINIGVFSDKSPFGYVDENGDYQGYDVYFAERIGEDLGVKINYVSTEAASRVEYLETGKVDIILANFTVTDERAEKVDFALPYMNVALGVVSHDDNVITDLSQVGADDQVIVISGTTAETYLTENNPEIKLQKFDTYAAAKSAFENGTGVAWANDNTEVIAFAIENEGYTVGIETLGSLDTIAPAVSKGNDSLLNWLNDEIKRSTMANTAAGILGASSDAVFSRINALRDADIRSEGNMSERSIARARRDDLSMRNSSMPEEIENGPADEPAEPEAKAPAVNDSATEDEINLLAYAMVLGDTLIDEKIVSRTDILRPADFTGDTMKTLVSELLGILDRSGTVSFARMTDYFRQYTINGAEAETVMMAPFDRADNERNVEVKRDMYLNYLYKIRLSACEKEEKRILALYSGATSEERTILQKNLQAISDYKDQMKNALGRL